MQYLAMSFKRSSLLAPTGHIQLSLMIWVVPCCGLEEVKKLKAFTDVGDEESMTRARWTSAKFVRHQLRVVLDNSYNPEAEPEDNLTDADLVVSHKDFWLMIRPAMGTMSKTDGMAILKRSAIHCLWEDAHHL